MTGRIGFVVLLLANSACVAGDGTWRAAGGGAWSDSSNWDSSVPNGEGDGATFGMWLPNADATVSLDTPVTVGSIDYHNLDRTVVEGPGPLILDTQENEPAIFRLHELAYELRLDTEVQIAAVDELIADVFAGSILRFTGSFGSGSAELSKLGDGVLRLAADNPLWDGAIEVSNGVVIADHPGALGATAVGTNVTGGVLRFEAASAEPVQLTRGSVIIDNLANSHVGPVTVSGGTLELDGLMSGPIGVFSGTVNLNHAAGLDGAISIYGGRFNLNDSSTAFAGPISMSGGRLIGNTSEPATYSGTLTIEDDGVATITADGGGSLTVAGDVVGRGQLQLVSSGSLIVEGAGFSHEGSLAVRGTGNTRLAASGNYTGPTTLNANRVTVQDAMALGDVAEGTVIQSGLVYMQSEGIREPIRVENGSLVLDTDRYLGPVTLAGGAIAADAFRRGYRRVLSGSLVVDRLGLVRNQDAVLVLESGFSGVGDIRFQRGSTVAVDGPIELQGEMVLDSGEVELNQPVTISTPIRFNGGVLVANRDVTLRDLRYASPVWLRSAPEATITAPELDPSGGHISANLAGIDSLRVSVLGKTTLENIGREFSGEVMVQSGLLNVTTNDGLGAPSGPIRVLGRENAAILLENGITVADDIHLSDASGFAHGGALLTIDRRGGGTETRVQGDVYLGDSGSSIGTVLGFSSTLQIEGGIHGGSLTVVGKGGRVNIAGGNHTYTGQTVVDEGALQLVEDGRLESTSGILINPFGSLVIENAEDAESTDRLADTIPIRLNGGQLELRVPERLFSAETVGPVTLGSGASTIRSWTGFSPQDTAQLTIGSLSRLPGATVELERRGIQLTTPPVLDDGILGGWARAGHHFVTYGEAGIQALSELDYHGDINTANPTDNVFLYDGATLEDDTVVNSLSLFDVDQLDLGGHRLTIESGGLIASERRTRFTNGQITAGTQPTPELILHREGSISADVVDSPVGSMGLTVSGEVELSGVNRYSGPTVVNYPGQLSINSAASVPPDNDVLLYGGFYFVQLPEPATIDLARVLVASEGRLASDDNDTFIRAESYDVWSGIIATRLAGDGPLHKTTNGIARLTRDNSEYTGDIVVDEGTLAVESGYGLGGGVTKLNPGARLVFNVPSNRVDPTIRGHIELAGGEIAGGPGAFTGQLNVVDDSRISLIGGLTADATGQALVEIAGDILGNGDLRVHGVEGAALILSGDNRQFTGQLILDGGTTSVRSRYALGSSKVTVGPRVLMSMESDSVTGDIFFDGGKLRFGRPGALPVEVSGTLEFGGESTIETVNSDLRVVADVTLRDAAELRVMPRRGDPRDTANVQLAGNLRVGQEARIKVQQSTIDLVGTVVSNASHASLDIAEARQALLDWSFEVQQDQSLSILLDGQPAKLDLGNGQSISGAGTLKNDVLLINEAIVQPGQTVGELSVQGNVGFGPSGVYRWQISDAVSIPGESNEWDTLNVAEALQITATPASPFAVVIQGLNDDCETGVVSSFDPSVAYAWTIAAADQIDGFAAELFAIDSSPFVGSNPIADTGQFLLQHVAGDLILRYDPEGNSSVPLMPGDANQDLAFDQFDLVQVLAAAKYLTDQPATWGEGDWDGAPGGNRGNPPAGDGRFNQLDIVRALDGGVYMSGPYGARSSLDDVSMQIASAPIPVPEPNTWAMCRLALLAMLAVGLSSRHSVPRMSLRCDSF